MRKFRIKEILSKVNGQLSRGEVNSDTFTPTKDQIDEGHFLTKYFDTVNNR